MAKVQNQLPGAASSTPSTQNVNKVQPFLGNNAVKAILILVGVLMAIGLIIKISSYWWSGGKKDGAGKPTASGSNTNFAVGTGEQKNTGGNNNAFIALFQSTGKDSGVKPPEPVKMKINDREWSPIVDFAAKTITTYGDSEVYFLIDQHQEYFIDKNQVIWKIETDENGNRMAIKGAKFPREASQFQFRAFSGKKVITYQITSGVDPARIRQTQ